MKEGSETEQSVLKALEVGYRSIDTAAAYRNEQSVGQALKASGLPREELFITTKCWTTDMRSGRVIEACEASLRELGMDYVDLYLLHWAVGDYVDCWRKMEKLLAEGKARANSAIS